MADNNENWDNLSRQSGQNRDQDKNRSNDENRNRYLGNNENYGNAGYGQDYDNNRNRRKNTGSQFNTGNQGNYNRTNYIPDNDENRDDRDRDYDNTQYGTSGSYGSRDEYGSDYNPGGYYRGSDQGSFGQSMNNRDDDSRREDWRRRDIGYGYYSRNESQGYYGANSGQQNRDDEYHNRNTGRMSGYRNDDDRYRNDDNSGMRNQSRNLSEGYKSSHEDRRVRGEQSWPNRTEGQHSGGHRGKGPKDYNRSADRIREDVCDRLSDDDYLDATDIAVQVEGNEVILSGTVQNREQKRRAEDLVESISGVRNVENRIRVGQYTSHDYTGTTDQIGGIGNESGTTNEVIRNAKKDQDRSGSSKSDRE